MTKPRLLSRPTIIGEWAFRGYSLAIATTRLNTRIAFWPCRIGCAKTASIAGSINMSNRQQKAGRSGVQGKWRNPVWSKNPIYMKSNDDGSKRAKLRCRPARRLDRGVTTRYITVESPCSGGGPKQRVGNFPLMWDCFQVADEPLISPGS